MDARRAIALALAALGALTTVAADTPSPNEPIPKPECNASSNITIRYSSASARLYLESATGERGGCVTIGQIWEAREGKTPLYAVDPTSGEISDEATGTWLLTETLYVEDGITLQARIEYCVLGLTCLLQGAWRHMYIANHRSKVTWIHFSPTVRAMCTALGMDMFTHELSNVGFVYPHIW